MAAKAEALRLAKFFGFEVDEGVTGLVGGCFFITLDHPTLSIGGDCRSIHIEDYGSGDTTPACSAWREAIDRMREEGPHLEPCRNPDCEYHAA